MSTVIDPILQRTLRDNRGQRLHVLIVLLAASRPLMLNEISETLNTSVRNLTDLMPRLAGDGYVYEINRRWVATDKARQLALPGLLSAPLQSEETNGSGLALIQARQVGAAQLSTGVDNRSEKSSDRSENFSDHRSVVVVDQAFDQSSTEETTTNNSAAAGKNFRSAADAQTLRAALTDAKVYGKRRRDLIADDWVTAERFTAWLEYASRLDALDNPAGFAILRCLDHIEPPEPEAEPQPQDDVATSWLRLLKNKPSR